MAEKVEKTVLVFYATGTPNDQDELNYHKFETFPNFDFETIQTIVGGPFQLLPHKRDDAQYVAYANEEGLAKQLRRNDLAGWALNRLGFLTENLPMGKAYAGNVVLMRNDEGSLTEEQISYLEREINKTVADWDDVPSEDEFDYVSEEEYAYGGPSDE